jgi:hypothetical protein
VVKDWSLTTLNTSHLTDISHVAFMGRCGGVEERCMEKGVGEVGRGWRGLRRR